MGHDEQVEARREEVQVTTPEEQNAVDAWQTLMAGKKRLKEGRDQMIAAAAKAAELAAASVAVPAPVNPNPLGPRGKAMSARQVRRANGQTNKEQDVRLVGIQMFDGSVVLQPSKRAVKRATPGKKR